MTPAPVEPFMAGVREKIVEIYKGRVSRSS
jgi:hypothetical protein